MAKSYYAILGISSMATADEVRAAYRRLAKAYHPDLYHGNSQNFREVQEAYNVLGNAERRRQYERQIHKAPVIRSSRPPSVSKPEPLIPETQAMHPEATAPMRAFQSFSPSTDALFDRMWSNFNSLLSPTCGRLRILTMEVPITQAQARRGGTINISVPAEARCPACQGHGSIGVYECSRCAGEGSISGEMPIAIAVPPNIPDSYKVMIPLDQHGIRNNQVTLIFKIVSH